MGRHKALLLATSLLILSLLFSACGKNESANSTTQKTEDVNTTEQTSAPTTKEDEPQKEESQIEEPTSNPFKKEEKVYFMTASFTLDKAEQEELKIPYVVAKESAVTLEIRNANGQKVASLLENTIHSKGEYQEYWDGFDFYGKPLPDGVYTLCLMDGKTKQETTVTLKNKPHTVYAKLNQTYFYETQPLSLQYTMQEAGPLDIRLYTAQQEEILTLLETSHQDTGEYTFNWDMLLKDGSALKAGDYVLYLSTSNAVEIIPFEVLPKTLVDGIYINEIAGENSADTALQINYSVIFPAKAKAFVEDQNGNIVRTLLKEQEMPKGDFALLWDLKDDKGNTLPNGSYSIQFDFCEGDFTTQKAVMYTIKNAPSTIKDVSLKNTIVDSKTEKAVLFYSITESTTGKIFVENEKGETVRTLFQEKPHDKGQYQIEWDLKDDKSHLVPLGNYRFVLVFGNEKYQTASFSLQDATDLKLTMEPNKTVSLSDESMQLLYAVNTNCLGTVQVYDAEGNLIRTLLKSENHNSGEHALTWDFQKEDGTKVPIGSYRFYFEFVKGETRVTNSREIYVS